MLKSDLADRSPLHEASKLQAAGTAAIAARVFLYWQRARVLSSVYFAPFTAYNHRAYRSMSPTAAALMRDQVAFGALCHLLLHNVVLRRLL